MKEALIWVKVITDLKPGGLDLLFGAVFRPDGSSEHSGSRQRRKLSEAAENHLLERKGEFLSLLLEKKIENLILKAYL